MGTPPTLLGTRQPHEEPINPVATQSTNFSTEFFFFLSLSGDSGSSSWRNYNIFFKILRYTSSENTVLKHLFLYFPKATTQLLTHRTTLYDSLLKWCFRQYIVWHLGFSEAQFNLYGEGFMALNVSNELMLMLLVQKIRKSS